MWPDIVAKENKVKERDWELGSNQRQRKIEMGVEIYID